MLTRFRQLLDVELSIAELIGIGVLLAGPYLLIGLVWSSTHAQSLHGIRGVELLVALLGSIALWPALLVANVCPA
ncbi:MAG: hypothetical protein QOJ56_1049 [Mycobacterium sp.]|jgi:hypothetical protein|nr:hypothetical protein [Mycobacterium sp.]